MPHSLSPSSYSTAMEIPQHTLVSTARDMWLSAVFASMAYLTDSWATSENIAAAAGGPWRAAVDPRTVLAFLTTSGHCSMPSRQREVLRRCEPRFTMRSRE